MSYHEENVTVWDRMRKLIRDNRDFFDEVNETLRPHEESIHDLAHELTDNLSNGAVISCEGMNRLLTGVARLGVIASGRQGRRLLIPDDELEASGSFNLSDSLKKDLEGIDLEL